MMKIEFVHGVEWLARNTHQTVGVTPYTTVVQVVQVNYAEWSKLTKEQRVAVLEHERMHEQFGTLHAEEMQGKEDKSRMSVPDECPLCGNAETCVDCTPTKSEVQLLREERVQLQKDIGEIGAEYAALRNKLSKLIDKWCLLPAWDRPDYQKMQELKALLEDN